MLSLISSYLEDHSKLMHSCILTFGDRFSSCRRYVQLTILSFQFLLLSEFLKENREGIWVVLHLAYNVVHLVCYHLVAILLHLLYANMLPCYQLAVRQVPRQFSC